MLVRAGLVTYGAVHLLVAWLAVQVAIGDGGKADKTGALQSIAGAGGAWLLWAIAVGLGANALWLLVEALLARESRTRLRLMHFGEAVLFGYVAFSAGKLAAGGAASSTDTAQRGLIGMLLAQEWGKPVVIAIGLAVVAAAVFIARHGLSCRFAEAHDYGSANPRMRRVVERLGKVGYTALGAVYGFAGVLVIVSAVQSAPEKATGLDVALKTAAAQPYGPALLVLIAAGLAAFAVFCFFEVRFRRA
jgi:hypothetical protein